MTAAPRAQLGAVSFTPGADAVAIAYVILDGTASGAMGAVATTQTALAAHAGTPNWGDTDVLALAQTLLDDENACLTAVLAS